MSAFERVLCKLVIVHLLILILVQGFFHPSTYLLNLNKVFLYEGVSSGMSEPPFNL
ncbi:DUF5359 family protein [Siminovitchia sp. 179-K 8D1 HS]|uniref:DUF5359 family protein n=1 Tax=Siminovitchia sp. 179-K 8D1 HS TaxID=3142385 RepID=UPI0039A3A78C